jgi:hypothetical protein
LPGDFENVSDTIYSYNYSLADWEGLGQSLISLDWNSEFSQLIGEDLWKHFHHVLFQNIDIYVPKKINRPKRNKKVYPKHISKLFTEKANLWRKFKNFRSDALKIKYNLASKLCREAVHNYILNKESSVVNSNNLGNFYKLANKKFSSKSGVGPLKSSDVGLTQNDQIKVELLSDYFGSVFTLDNNVMPPFEEKVDLDNGLNNIIFDSQMVFKAIKKLKDGSAPGPDGIRPVFLKKWQKS